MLGNSCIVASKQEVCEDKADILEEKIEDR